MSQVVISFGFPVGSNPETYPTLTTSVTNGSPLVGDVIHFGDNARFIVEGRAWLVTEAGTELHITLKAVSVPR